MPRVRACRCRRILSPMAIRAIPSLTDPAAGSVKRPAAIPPSVSAVAMGTVRSDKNRPRIRISLRARIIRTLATVVVATGVRRRLPLQAAAQKCNAAHRVVRARSRLAVATLGISSSRRHSTHRAGIISNKVVVIAAATLVGTAPPPATAAAAAAAGTPTTLLQTATWEMS